MELRISDLENNISLAEKACDNTEQWVREAEEKYQKRANKVAARKGEDLPYSYNKMSVDDLADFYKRELAKEQQNYGVTPVLNDNSVKDNREENHQEENATQETLQEKEAALIPVIRIYENDTVRYEASGDLSPDQVEAITAAARNKESKALVIFPSWRKLGEVASGVKPVTDTLLFSPETGEFVTPSDEVSANIRKAHQEIIADVIASLGESADKMFEQGFRPKNNLALHEIGDNTLSLAVGDTVVATGVYGQDGKIVASEVNTARVNLSDDALNSLAALKDCSSVQEWVSKGGDLIKSEENVRQISKELQAWKNREKVSPEVQKSQSKGMKMA